VYKYIFYNINIIDAELHRSVYLHDYRFKQQLPDKTYFWRPLTKASEYSKVVKSGDKSTYQIS